MKLPYGYVLIEGEIAVHEEKENVVCSIFDAYLAGASLGKIVDMLFAKGILSPTGKTKWTRAAVDKLLTKKNISHWLALGYRWTHSLRGPSAAT